MNGERETVNGKTLVAAAIAAALVAGCSSAPPKREASIERATPRTERPRAIARTPAPAPSTGGFRRGSGYYLDDGPGDSPPPDLDKVPDAVPQLEPLRAATMRPYVVMGQTYTPMTELQPYKAQGVATWYGRRYHGRQTSSGEPYDMYGMTAAHPTLPIPSYVRVTNVASGRSVVVRVNDRGPFIDNRLIDLSYTAAYKLGVLAGGSAVVEVETILPDAIGPGTAFARARPPAQPAVTVATVKPPASVTPELANAPDPILAIAAAAAAADAPAASPLPEAPREPVAARPPAPQASGVYLQLGAFGSRENAESYLARARVQLESLAQPLHLFPRDGMYRVQAGPYASQTEARQAAERIGVALGMKPLVVSR